MGRLQQISAGLLILSFTSLQASTPAKSSAKIVELEKGLKYEILEKGDLKNGVAESGNTVTVHYRGWLEEKDGKKGKQFDASVKDKEPMTLKNGRPFTFPLGAGRVIQGWDKGVVKMNVGEMRRLIIAPELAYGSSGAGQVIPPNATLIFEVKLLQIQPKP